MKIEPDAKPHVSGMPLRREAQEGKVAGGGDIMCSHGSGLTDPAFVLVTGSA